MAGRTINVQIYERDTYAGDDPITPKSITFDAYGWGYATWTADWDNGDGWSPYQSYYVYYA